MTAACIHVGDKMVTGAYHRSSPLVRQTRTRNRILHEAEDFRWESAIGSMHAQTIVANRLTGFLK